MPKAFRTDTPFAGMLLHQFDGLRAVGDRKRNNRGAPLFHRGRVLLAGIAGSHDAILQHKRRDPELVQPARHRPAFVLDRQNAKAASGANNPARAVGLLRGW
jgi:hypothetical protein